MTDKKVVHHRCRPWNGRRYRKAALAAGHAVVATGREPGAVAGPRRRRRPAGGQARRHRPGQTPRPRSRPPSHASGGSTSLVNNAGNFYAGFFEEITPRTSAAQVETNLFGPLNVTRAVLPVMRAQRSGLVVRISSTAGIAGPSSARPTLRRSSASRAGSSRWRPRSRRSASAPCSWARLLPHRALTPESTNYAEPSIEDYAERTRADSRRLERHERPAGRRPRQARRSARSGSRARRAAAALGRWRRRRRRPRTEGEDLLAQADAYRELSSSLAHTDA